MQHVCLLSKGQTSEAHVMELCKTA